MQIFAITFEMSQIMEYRFGLIFAKMLFSKILAMGDVTLGHHNNLLIQVVLKLTSFVSSLICCSIKVYYNFSFKNYSEND